MATYPVLKLEDHLLNARGVVDYVDEKTASSGIFVQGDDSEHVKLKEGIEEVLVGDAQNKTKLNINGSFEVSELLGVGVGDPQYRAHIGPAIADYNPGGTPPQPGISLYVEGRALFNQTGQVSDARRKNVLQLSDGEEDLRVLKSIKVTDYEMKDSREKHHSVEKKLLAQELEEVYPTAVSKSEGWVPDVYQEAQQVQVGERTLKLKLKIQVGLKEGERVKLELKKSTSSIVSEVFYKLPIASVKGTEIEFNLTADQYAKLEGHDWNVFVYGRYVEDLRSVDYTAVSMLNVSATQELSKKQETQAQEIQNLKASLAQKDKELQELKEIVNQLKAKFLD